MAPSRIVVGTGFVAGALLVAAVAASCTTFDGLTAGAVDGSATDANGLPDVKDAGDAGPDLPGFIPLLDAVKVCTNALKCPNLAQSVIYSVDVPLDRANFSSCVNWLAGPLPPNRLVSPNIVKELTCVSLATSCAEADACMFHEIISPNDPRCAGTDGGSCQQDGGEAVNCADGYVDHCHDAVYSPGTICVIGSDKTANCVKAKTCSPDTCKGNILEYCDPTLGLYFSQDCNMFGLACGTDVDSGTQDCELDGSIPLCSNLGVSCNGTTVEVCDGYYRSPYDCKALGGTCDSTGFARCKRPTDQCSPTDVGINDCVGGSVSLCVGGRKIDFACSSVAMTCVPGNAQTSGHCE